MAALALAQPAQVAVVVVLVFMPGLFAGPGLVVVAVGVRVQVRVRPEQALDGAAHGRVVEDLALAMGRRFIKCPHLHRHVACSKI